MEPIQDLTRTKRRDFRQPASLIAAVDAERPYAAVGRGRAV
jgi:hypothetical protein